MSSTPSGKLELYPDVPLPKGTWWKNALAVQEYNSLKKTLERARTTQSLETVVAHIKTRQFKLTTKKNVFDISYLLSFGLGLAMATGLALIAQCGSLVDFGIFLVLVSFFHMWEYSYVSLFHPETLSFESFLLTHSKAFQIAMSFAITEYFIEWYFFPSLKGNLWIYGIGFLVAVAGQAIRTTAMYTAGVSFHHMVQDTKAENHTLVSTGIYAIWRHPSYFGWFWWSVFSQVILANPISIIGFAYASWKFFADRIPDEEDKLKEMFGQDYVNYCKRVPIRIPFIPSNY
jgi:protein-S-isoprenylcysteine O-methyltransferase